MADLPADPAAAVDELDARLAAPTYERMPIPDAAAAELRVRYQARQRAEERLVDYLAGLVAALDIDPDRLSGFDDATGELLITPGG